MPFDAEVVENVIVVLRRQISAEAREDNEVLVTEPGKSKEKRIPQSAFRQTLNCSFVAHLSPKLMTLKEKIDARSTKLRKLANVNQAIALKHDLSSCQYVQGYTMVGFRQFVFPHHAETD